MTRIKKSLSESFVIFSSKISEGPFFVFFSDEQKPCKKEFLQKRGGKGSSTVIKNFDIIYFIWFSTNYCKIECHFWIWGGWCLRFLRTNHPPLSLPPTQPGTTAASFWKIKIYKKYVLFASQFGILSPKCVSDFHSFKQKLW